jgi:DNA-binding PadR family transcriptional regulator
MKLTTLDALLLFLVSHKGQSGYDIRQLFRSTPIGLFSDSPGAIYPAMARLEMRGLLTSDAETDGRRKRLYRSTELGERALERWLTGPIEPDVVARRPQDLDLRFVMLAERLGRDAAEAFLADYASAVQARHDQIQTFYDGQGAEMSRASREAMQLGLRLDRARLGWCRDLLSQSGENQDENHKLRVTGA